ncbi:MAG: glycosyltransferase family 4 protein, partial [Gammaproteobacteria bacterium]
MNVLYICADWGIPIRGFKGASVHVREFVDALTRGGNEVWLLCTDRGEGNPYPHATVIEIEPQLSQERREKEAARLGLAFDPQDVAVCHELDKLSYDTEFATRALAELSQ